MSSSCGFNIAIDDHHGQLTATLTGIWTADIVDRYASALRDAARSVARHDRKARWLIDLSNFPVQPREVAARLTAVVPATQAAMGAVVAIVTSQALLAMQARRVGSRDIRVFSDAEAAYAWLEEQ